MFYQVSLVNSSFFPVKIRENACFSRKKPPFSPCSPVKIRENSWFSRKKPTFSHIFPMFHGEHPLFPRCFHGGLRQRPRRSVPARRAAAAGGAASGAAAGQRRPRGQAFNDGDIIPKTSPQIIYIYIHIHIYIYTYISIYMYIYIYMYIFIYIMYIPFYHIIDIIIHYINPGLINPVSGCLIGGIPFMYHIICIYIYIHIPL